MIIAHQLFPNELGSFGALIVVIGLAWVITLIALAYNVLAGLCEWVGRRARGQPTIQSSSVVPIFNSIRRWPAIGLLLGLPLIALGGWLFTQGFITRFIQSHSDTPNLMLVGSVFLVPGIICFGCWLKRA